MTDTEIIAEAQSLTRQNLGIATATYASWLNRIMKRYGRLQSWPQLKLMGQTISTVAGTNTYALVSGFDRFAGSTVFYNPTAITGGYQDGIPLPILLTGDTRDDDKIAYWRQSGAGRPQAVTLGMVGAVLSLYVYPVPDVGSVTILYDCIKAPTTMTGLGVVPDVQALCGVLTMELCADICRFTNDREGRMGFLQDAKREYAAALSNLFIA